MGFRFQKRISILPGVRSNLSKTGASWSVNTAIETVAISAYTQRSASTGRIGDEYAGSVEVRREGWDEIDKGAMASIDPRNLLRWLGAQIDTNSRGMLLVQQPSR